jgi:hypothetical protein
MYRKVAISPTEYIKQEKPGEPTNVPNEPSSNLAEQCGNI